MADDDLDDDDCWKCGGEGWFDGYEDDPLWYEPGDFYPCEECRGTGHLPVIWEQQR